MKKIIKNIEISIIVLIIIIVTLLIGTPINEKNINYIYIILGIFIISLFLKDIIKKEKIEINKMDLVIGILVISTTLALVFQKYASLSDAINGILKMFLILNVYLIIKNECKKNPKYIDIIINTIIISILILCVIGLDEIGKNYLEELKKQLNYNYIEYDEIRIGSLFAYPNTMGAISGLGIFLCMSYIYKSKNIKIKIIYIVLSIIMLITMILTYSRLVYIMLSIFLAIYLLILAKRYKIQEKINAKKIIIFVIIALIILGYIIIGLKISTSVEIKNNFQKILYSVNPNTDYVFEFEIESISKENGDCIIKFTEKNEYFDDIKETEIKFGTYAGTKEIKIHTQDSTKIMYINIEKLSEESKLIINDVKLNGEKFILQYKLLPTKLVDKIINISFNNKSVWERAQFIKDALEIIKDNWLFGIGENGWRYYQLKVQDYNYYAQEVHCYPIQTFLENGIFGFLACLGIYIYVLKNLIIEFKQKEIDMPPISYLLGILFVLFHSLLDFDMSFLYVELIIFIMIAILNSKKQNIIKIRYQNLLYIIAIIINIITIYSAIVVNSFRNDSEITVISSKRTEEKIFGTYYKLLPFNRNIKIKNYKILIKNKKSKEAYVMLEDLIKNEKYIYMNVSLENILQYIEISRPSKEQIEFITKYIYETKDIYKYYPSYQINRLNNFKNIIEILSDTENIEKLKKQYIKEIEEKEKYILDYQKSRYDKENVKEYKTILEELKRDINENISTNVNI